MQQTSRQLGTMRMPSIASEFTRLAIALTLLSELSSTLKARDEVRALVNEHCVACHNESTRQGGLDLTSLSIELDDGTVRNRWIQIYDRVTKREMPPDPKGLAESQRELLLKSLHKVIAAADRKEVLANGRGPMRRLTRGEFEQNLRDILKLPRLDIQNRLPEDRVKHGFNRTADALDMSRIQLAAYLDAVDIALRQATVTEAKPPSVTKYRAAGRQLFSATGTFGGRQAMFFVKKNQAVSNEDLEASPDDPALELALFRSAHWPYYGYPRGFVAKLPGEYRVRFSARSVLQTDGFQLKPGKRPVPMTFRARKPSGPDVSGDVRATGGLMDILPEAKTFETTIWLLPTETFEDSVLGLPVPLARNVDGGPPTYRYPPFPEGGQPGVAVQWLELEGPIPPKIWPPASHRVLFDNLGIAPADPAKSARRLLRRFVKRAAREPVDEQTLASYEKLILSRLEKQTPFQQAMLTGYKAFLCSSSFLYLRDPSDSTTRDVEQFAIASRLSHFLTNSRPDDALLKLAQQGKLRDSVTLKSETERLIAAPEFERFAENFTDYWLNLRHILREEPDVRLFPEYRFDNYLIESMERETRRFFVAMIRDNLPASVLIDTDFAYVNDRLAQHYGLPPLNGSWLRKVSLPEQSPYGGFLTQAAILKVTSTGTSTSPVIRGAWIMERLLGEHPPPPPTSVPAVEPDIRGAKTIRELLAAHTKDESCAACHARFDPVGMALENFDILGKWRTRYRSVGETALIPGEAKTESRLGKSQSHRLVTGIDRAGHDFSYALAEPVDSAGRLRDGRSFFGIQQLKTMLAANPRPLARNLLHQFTVYSTGTPVRFSDRDQIEAILDDCAVNGFRVRDLIHGLVESEIFLGKDRER